MCVAFAHLRGEPWLVWSVLWQRDKICFNGCGLCLEVDCGYICIFGVGDLWTSASFVSRLVVFRGLQKRRPGCWGVFIEG